MALAYLLDEHFRGQLWQAIQHHNAAGANPLDVLRVGDSPAPPCGTGDPDLLTWGEANQRILVSADRSTMPGFFTLHLQAGHHSPGVFIVRPGSTLAALVAALVLHDFAGDPADYVDRLEYIP